MNDDLAARIAALPSRIPLELRCPEQALGDLETLWGFSLREEPYVMAQMDDPLEGMLVDEAKCRRISVELGEPMVLMEAPPQLKKLGLGLFGAYRRGVLDKACQ